MFGDGDKKVVMGDGQKGKEERGHDQAGTHSYYCSEVQVISQIEQLNNYLQGVSEEQVGWWRGEPTWGELDTRVRV